MTSDSPSRDELKERLTDEQYGMTRGKGIERPFTGRWQYNKEGAA